MISNINDIVKEYISQTKYDIENSLGNCSFFTRDFINWAKEKGVKADYVYMPMSDEYRKENNISDDEWEDHIVPMINGVIIDFTYTPQGVSKNVRTSNTIPPKLFRLSKSLFEPNGVYGKLGYTKPEINTEYGNPKDINSFDVTEPNLKKELNESVKKIIYTKPNFDNEWEEAIRYPEFEHLGKEGWLKLAELGYVTNYSKIEDVLGNVDLDFDNLEQNKIERFNKAFELGKIEVPIAVKFSDNDYDLVAGNTRLSGLVSKGIDPKIWVVDIEKLINLAHTSITRIKGKEYAPDIHEIQAWIDNYLGVKKDDIAEAKKTDFSKEKSQGLHGWFARRGGKGKSKGWVDCNTCRKDPETGRKKCKSCGRKPGEKRKYPACRPTPASCGTRGKGKKWGKKSNNESENKNEMKNLIAQKLHEMVQEGHSEFQNYMFFNNLKTIREAIDEILQMDAHAVDQLLSDGHNWATDHMATSADDIEEVYHFLNATLDEHEPDSYHGETEVGYEDEYGSVEDGSHMMNEAEYKGRKVQLGKPTRGDVKKYKVFVKNAKGKVVKVNFGDKNMEIKRDNPKRRKSFRARHKCAQAKDRTTPKYWSCRMWSKKPVSKIVGESFGFDENTRIFVKNNEMTQPATKPLVPETKPKTTPNQPVKPSRKNKPFLPEVTPGIKTDPKGLNEGKFDFETYHKTLASALQEIERYAISRGFDQIEFGPFDVEHVAYGQTKVMHLDLKKDGMPARRKLQVQIYRMDGGTYELNMYIG